MGREVRTLIGHPSASRRQVETWRVSSKKNPVEPPARSTSPAQSETKNVLPSRTVSRRSEASPEGLTDLSSAPDKLNGHGGDHADTRRSSSCAHSLRHHQPPRQPGAMAPIS